ncbi:Ammonium transporter Rh type C [Frankliniella fusca]|uniref:Ammonium transporter Rh type C n=1 Tax=Frankliniella fusca TaxID=407009 RepID=A0AAE1H042_9NEOP|nr:Ammonium transporter Rh type C [Frankliniella fusca]
MILWCHETVSVLLVAQIFLIGLYGIFTKYDKDVDPKTAGKVSDLENYYPSEGEWGLAGRGGEHGQRYRTWHQQCRGTSERLPGPRGKGSN